MIKQEIKLRQVSNLQEEKSNNIVKCEDILSNYSESYIANKSAYYIPYNFQYEDKGWGCAWRAIQMILSAYYEEIPNFLDLFHKYSRKNLLIKIAEDKKIMNQKLDLQKLKQSNFAPQCQNNNWAQPFICKLVCEDKNIKNKLILVNGYPNANAPQYVFQQVVDFVKFIKIIKQNIDYSPIMIDDGYLAMTILGFQEQSEQQYSFLIGDPHILSNKIVKQAGIYQVVFNNKGKQIKNNVNQNQLKEGYLEVVNQIDFENKNWMSLYTFGLN